MDALKQKLVNQHYQDLLAIEDKYLNLFNRLYQQKAMAQLALQQSFCRNLLELNECTQQQQSVGVQHANNAQNGVTDQMRAQLHNVLQSMQTLVNDGAPANGNMNMLMNANPLLSPPAAVNPAPMNPQHESKQPHSFVCKFCSSTFDTKINLDVHESLHLLQQVPLKPEIQFNAFAISPQSQSQQPVPLSLHTQSPVSSTSASTTTTSSNFDISNNGGVKQECTHSISGAHIKEQVCIRPLPAMCDIPPVTKPFCCQQCNKCFRQKRELDRHIINKHTPNHEKPYKCRYCDYGAATRSIVRRHEYTHSDTKPYRCTLCKYQTSYKYIFKKHLQKAHGVESTAGRVVAHASGSEHDSDKEDDDEDEDEDDELEEESDSDAEQDSGAESGMQEVKPEKTNDAQTGIAHTDTTDTTDTENKKWKCTHCDKRFFAKSLMKQHQAIHNGPKDWKCDQCQFATAHKRSLIRHKLIHSGDKPFFCVVCHKKFRTKELLNNHAQQHKPFVGKAGKHSSISLLFG